MSGTGHPVDKIIDLLRANPIDFAGDLTELRERFDALGARPDGTDQLVTTELGGVRVIAIPGDAARGPIVFVHAGGYVAGTAAGTIGLAAALARETGRRVVSVDYSLAPEHPFPTARDEVIRVYRALLAQGVEPGAMTLVGASAGGGIVLQTVQQLRDEGARLPAAIALISPFCDLTLSGSSYAGNATRDPSLDRSGLAAAAAHYAATGAAAERPTPTALRGLPPMLVQAGSLEILLSDSVDLVDAAAAADVHVELVIWPGMIHVFPTFAALVPEGVDALRRIGSFFDRLSS